MCSENIHHRAVELLKKEEKFCKTTTSQEGVMLFTCSKKTPNQQNKKTPNKQNFSVLNRYEVQRLRLGEHKIDCSHNVIANDTLFLTREFLAVSTQRSHKRHGKKLA